MTNVKIDLFGIFRQTVRYIPIDKSFNPNLLWQTENMADSVGLNITGCKCAFAVWLNQMVRNMGINQESQEEAKFNLNLPKKHYQRLEWGAYGGTIYPEIPVKWMIPPPTP